MKSLIILLVVTYTGLSAALYFLQKKLLYFPQPAIGIKEAEIVEVKNDDIVLSGWVVNGDKDLAIIYFGGNAEVIEQNARQFRRIFPNYAIYFIPYRGYGNNKGEPSEQHLYNDAIAVYDHIKSKHQSISLIGRSLGSGVATYLTNHRPIEKLALITPYDSIVNVAHTHYPIFPTSLLVNQRFESDKYAANVNCDTLIFIAELDEIIPPKHSKALAKLIPQTHVQTIVIDDAFHNDVSESLPFEVAISRFFQKEPSHGVNQ